MISPRQLARAFRRIPLLAELTPADFKVSLLRGYTNWNYRIEDGARDWIVRIPRAETNAHIDRAAEAHNQSIASELGLAPQCLWRDASGLSLTPTISGGREICPPDLSSPAITARIVASLQLLHRSHRTFNSVIDLPALLERYFSLLTGARQQQLAPRFEQAQISLEALKSRDRAAVPSHNDLVLENLLLDGERLWLIDWEYSAMASPYWDLATLCNEAGLDAAQSAKLLHTYCAAGTPMEESTLSSYRQLLQLLSDCWMAAFADH